MRDESLTDAIGLVSSERAPAIEHPPVETAITLELRRTVVFLAIFVGLLILRYS
ncbi:MAG TPA: hypothetical protein VMT61_13020 [Candidatus Binataceae bacterium]|nr:hypothetical protein [Candidatus Binataceae bacterium]